MKELFLDCSTGVAGDMLCASLLELCPNEADMLIKLNSLGIPGIEYVAQKTIRHSVSGTQLSVKYLGVEEEQGCQHKHHEHHHSKLCDIDSIIAALNMPLKVKQDVKNIYSIIAKAEARVHGCEIENIHFHELGTMDALADISAACFIINELGIEHIVSSPICTGYGEIKCAHGILPVPAPATAHILEGIPSFAGDMEGELCTPTGAAIIKYLADSFSQMPNITVDKFGYGMGKKVFPKLSAVRSALGNTEETIVELCCNVDDMSPESIGFAIDELLRCGAPDAYYIQIGMKKNRPGVILTCLCREQQRDEMVQLIFKHTTTLGIRETVCRRYILKRHEETVLTPYGNVRIKFAEGYGAERKKAEYDDLARIAHSETITIEQARKIASDCLAHIQQ